MVLGFGCTTEVKGVIIGKDGREPFAPIPKMSLSRRETFFFNTATGPAGGGVAVRSSSSSSSSTIARA